MGNIGAQTVINTGGGVASGKDQFSVSGHIRAAKALLPGIANEGPGGIAYNIIPTDGAEVLIEGTDLRRGEIVICQPGDRRLGHGGQHLLHALIETRGWYRIVGKRDAAGTIGITTQRIINNVTWQKAAEIAIAKSLNG